MVNWKPPEDQWVKINVDGATSNNGSLISCGGVIRDIEGRWIKGFAIKLGSGSVLLAEMWGILLGITNEGHLDHPLSPIILKIQRLMNQHQNVKVTHAYRGANHLADALASHACRLNCKEEIFDRVPSFCNLIFQEDIRKLCFPRRVAA
ncbi:putative non-LTR retroelement reverse transcriptase [Senna tora]|uniref:Putative non-LTR retroelement reverse transcriptase n=1 Tax=Senna tora TaxID=362788 RepID=A0A834TLY7_9FABA|nr:putative non-LTR retroelement reverse transcriptase [Senna tora]